MASVLITGAAKRVGKEIALDMARSGWNIVVHYNSSKDEAGATAAEIESLGVKVNVVQGDLADLENVGHIMQQAGRVECLIHNASVFEKDSIFDMTPESWQKHMDVNLTAPMFLNQAFLNQAWIKALSYDEDQDVAAAANIICLSDGMRGWSINSNFMSYSLSRLAAEQSIALLAQAAAPHVRVNGIALGATIEGHMDKADTFQKICQQSDLKRVSNASEVCDAVRYILGANSVMGQVINLSGYAG